MKPSGRFVYTERLDRGEFRLVGGRRAPIQSPLVLLYSRGQAFARIDFFRLSQSYVAARSLLSFGSFKVVTTTVDECISYRRFICHRCQRERSETTGTLSCTVEGRRHQAPPVPSSCWQTTIESCWSPPPRSQPSPSEGSALRRGTRNHPPRLATAQTPSARDACARYDRQVRADERGHGKTQGS